MNSLLSHDTLWKQFYQRVADSSKVTTLMTRQYMKENSEYYGDIGFTSLTWKELYKMLPRWKWGSNSNHKAPELKIIDDLIVIRDDKCGRNPAAMTTTPLTRLHPFFRVEVRQLGAWVGIGVADKNYVLSAGSTLGTQAKSVNSSYFWQNTGIRKLQMHGEPSSSEVAEIREGDMIDVKADFDSNMLYYYNNDVLQGVIACTKNKLLEEQLYPCVNLSHGTELCLRNFDQPALDTTYRWKWATAPSKKAKAITVSDDCLVASRDTPKGLNPAVQATFPLTRRSCHFRVRILRLGKWIGIGICDAHFGIDGSKTLGTQTKGINSAYFFQSTGINKLQMYGEKSQDNVRPICVGDIIDVKIDFDLNRIYYFNNEELQGFFSPFKKVLKDGCIYPCVDMSIGSELVFISEEEAKLDIRRSWSNLLRECPTQWKWSNVKKAASIRLWDEAVRATREMGGTNSAVLSLDPLTRSNCFFVIEVLRLGTWIGIGVADQTFQVDEANVLGTQRNCINCGYFCQASIRKIQMHGGKEIVDGVQPICVRDYIGVKLNFDTNEILFYNNDVLQGVMTCPMSLEEVKLYPCVNLSLGTEIIFRNNSEQ